MQRRCFLAGLAAAAAGCAPLEKTSAPNDLARIRSVAPIAALEDRFELSYVGLTVFNNEQEVISPGWKANDHVLALLDSTLRVRREVRPVRYDPAAFRGADVGVVDARLGKPSELGPRLRSVVQPGVADAILVIAGPKVGYIDSARQGFWVGVNYTATLFDGASFEPVGRVLSAVRCKLAVCLREDMTSRRDATLSWRWRGEPFAKMPQAVQDDIRRQVFAVMDESLLYSVQRLGLA